MHVATVLVVDDEPQIRRVLRATLSSNGYEVIEAKSGQEAIEMVVTERPELILLSRCEHAGYERSRGLQQDSIVV